MLSILISLLFGCNSLNKILSKEVFPEPLLPKIPVIFPFSALKYIDFKILVFPKFNSTLSISIFHLMQILVPLSTIGLIKKRNTYNFSVEIPKL